MARYGPADVAWLLIGGMNVLGDTTSIEDNREALLEETTVLGQSWEEQSYVGVSRYTIQQQGFYNDGANRSNAALINPGASKVLCFAPEGGVIGDLFIGSPLVQATYVRQISRGALHKANATYQSEGQHDEGVILHALGAETGDDGDTEDDSVDNGASSAAGGAGYLQVTALTLGGYDDVSFAVSHSADDSTFVDLVTFVDVASAPNAQRVAVSGTVNRYLASNYEFNGSGSTQSVTYMIGFARY